MNISRKSSLSTRRWSRSINNETFSGPGSTNPDRFENASFSPPPPKPRSDYLKVTEGKKDYFDPPNKQSFFPLAREFSIINPIPVNPNPAIPPPIPFVRAHKHFFPPLCRSITPLFTDSHKSALFFFFSSFLSRSLVIRSFVHSPLSPHPPRIYIPARFPSIPWIQRPREPAKFRGWILSTARGGRRIAHGVGLTTG